MKLSLIIPCYNESSRLAFLFNALEDFVFSGKKDGDTFDVIFVNDGSTDQTHQLIKQYIDVSHLDLSLLSYSTNYGKGHAIKRGVLESNADYFLIMDADVATDMQHINEFWDGRYLSDICIADRNALQPHRTLFRKLGGKIGRTLINLVLGLDYPDTQCGFKLFSKTTLPLFEAMKINRWGFDFELLYLAKLHHYSVCTKGVHRIDQPDSKVNVFAYFDTFYELMLVKSYWHPNRFTSITSYLYYIFNGFYTVMKNTLLYAALLSLGIYSTIGTSFAQIVSENGGSSYSYNTGSYYGYNDNRSDTSIDFDATGQTGDNVYATGSSSWSYNYGHTGSSNYGWGTHTFTNPGNLSSQTGYATGYGYGTQQSNAVDTTFLQYGTGSSYYHQLSVNESYFETNYGYGSSWYHFDGFGVKYGFGSSRYNGSSTGYSSGYSSWSYGNGTSSGYSESLYQSNSSNVNNGSNSWWYNNCGYGYGSAWRNVSQYGGASSYNYNGNGTSFDSPLTSNEFGFATSQSFPYVDCGYGMGTNYGGGTSSGSTGQVYTGWSGQTFTGRVQGVCDYFNQQFELTQWSLYESLLDYFNCNVGNQPIMIIQDPYICGSSLKGKITSSDPLNYQNVQLHLYSGSTLTYSFAPVISSDGAFEQLIDYDNATASNYVIPGVYTYEYIGSDYRGVASGSYQVNIQKNCTPSGGSYSGPVGSPTPSGSGLQTTGIVSELINRVELSVEEKLLESVNTIQEIVHLIDSVQPFSSLIKKSHPAASLLPSTGVNE